MVIFTKKGRVNWEEKYQTLDEKYSILYDKYKEAESEIKTEIKSYWIFRA